MEPSLRCYPAGSHVRRCLVRPEPSWSSDQRRSHAERCAQFRIGSRCRGRLSQRLYVPRFTGVRTTRFTFLISPPRKFCVCRGSAAVTSASACFKRARSCVASAWLKVSVVSWGGRMLSSLLPLVPYHRRFSWRALRSHLTSVRNSRLLGMHAHNYLQACNYVVNTCSRRFRAGNTPDLIRF